MKVSWISFLDLAWLTSRFRIQPKTVPSTVPSHGSIWSIDSIAFKYGSNPV